MSDILILQATGRTSGTVATMVSKFVKKAESVQNDKLNSVEIVDVTKLKFSPCIGCMKCRSEKRCIFSGDDADKVGEKMEKADVIAVAAPVYWGNMPGILKAFFDRNVFRMMEETKMGIPKPLLKGKKGIIITACSTPFPFNIFCGQTTGLVRSINEIFKSSGIKKCGVISVPGTKLKQEVSKMDKKIFSVANKTIKALMILSCLSFFTKNVSAQETKTGWEFFAVTDTAVYPKTDYVSGNTHFAPVTGVFDSLELRTALHATYTIPVPFSDNMLFSGNTFSVDTALAISPISIMPKLTLSFTPIAFFNFKAGANIGTAWEAMGIKSISKYNPEKAEYEQMDAFKTWFYQFWICSTFMFDTAAIFPGDWNHIVMVASYELNYAGLINADSDCDMFQWQTTDAMVEGAQYVSTYILGYQMPIVLSLIGAQLEFSGYMNDSDFDKKYEKYDGDFMTISVSPLAQITLSKKDSIFLLATISSRRSFEQNHDDIEEEPLLTKSGREWYFERLACRWTHKF